MSFNKRLILVILTVLLLAIPIYLISLWFYVCSHISGYPATELLYYSYLPHFLDGRYACTLFSLSFCVVAMILNIPKQRSIPKWFRVFSKIAFILSAFLAFANLWSIM